MPIVVALLVALSGGCVMGARVNGGVLAGDGGTTGFIGGTLQIGMADRELARATLEYGGVTSEHPAASRVGLRYTAGAGGRLTWTASAALEDAAAPTRPRSARVGAQLGVDLGWFNLMR